MPFPSADALEASVAVHFPAGEPNRLGRLIEALTLMLADRGVPGREVVVCCIGTDRSTGDAFGPLTGQLLERAWRRPGAVIGTIADPLHALNLSERTAHLSGVETPLVIAVDAALGALDAIGTIHLVPRGLEPGQGVGKEIPRIGELSLTATVNVQAGPMSAQVLQSTRLHLVQQLAQTAGYALIGAMRRLERAGSLNAAA